MSCKGARAQVRAALCSLNIAGACRSLPGGQTAEGFPVGFQIVDRHMEEALLLRAGHAFQQAMEWHRRRPSVEQ
jgi:Asp-tRNA(Asn)/Glu-tRNA(Gln) amidotransferase A subunit family amidase